MGGSGPAPTVTRRTPPKGRTVLTLLPTLTAAGISQTAVTIARDVVLAIVVLLTIKNAIKLVTGGGGLGRFFASMLPVLAMAGIATWILADPSANLGTLGGIVGGVVTAALDWVKSATA